MCADMNLRKFSAHSIWIIWPSTEVSGIWQKDLGPISNRAEIFKETAKMKMMYVTV